MGCVRIVGALFGNHTNKAFETHAKLEALGSPNRSDDPMPGKCQVKKTTRARNLIHAGSFSDFFRGVCRKTLRLLAPTFADLVDYPQNSEMLVVVFCAIIPNLTPIFFYSRTGTGILKNIGRNPTSELWSLKARLFEIELTFSANSGE